ncbi:MAG: Spy/CpxP family protein refolding chaperone [Leptolyngbyaceae cyanobacterium]
MKRSFSVLLAAMLGLTLSWASAKAQTSPEQRLDKTESALASAKRTRKDALSSAEELDLSEDQQLEIEAIQTSMNNELSEVLNDDQMEQLTTAQAEGDSMRSVMRSLGLTSSQRSSVMSLMRDTQSQVMDVLTPEQRAQLEEEMPRDRR